MQGQMYVSYDGVQRRFLLSEDDAYHAVKELVSVSRFGGLQRFQEDCETYVSVFIIQRWLTRDPGWKQLHTLTQEHGQGNVQCEKLSSLGWKVRRTPSRHFSLQSVWATGVADHQL